MKKYFFILIFISLGLIANAQSRKGSALYGLGVLHNFQTNGTAIDLRAGFPIIGNLYVSPRFSYFPAFNDIHEFYAGTDLDFYLPLKRTLVPYVYAGGYYNNWINSSDYQNKISRKNNFVFEGGAGIILSFKCFYPFLEYRYDTKWKEGSVGAGLLLRLGECVNMKSGGARNCPRF